MARVHKPALAEVLPSAHGGRGQHVRREATMMIPPFTHHSTMVLHFCGSLSFLQAFPVVEILTPIPSGWLHSQ